MNIPCIISLTLYATNFDYLQALSLISSIISYAFKYFCQIFSICTFITAQISFESPEDSSYSSYFHDSSLDFWYIFSHRIKVLKQTEPLRCYSRELAVHLEYNSRAGSRRPLLSWCGAPLPDGAVWAALIVSCPSAHALEGVSEDACPFLSWFYLFASLVDDGAGGWCSSSSRCWWSAATQSDNCRADFWCSDRVANWSIMIPLGLSACFFGGEFLWVLGLLYQGCCLLQLWCI